MSTFFSGTDRATLKEEGLDRNHFVSLIVNNEGTYTAAITRKVTYTEHRDVTYPSYNGQVIKATEDFEEVESVEWFYLKVKIEGDSFDELNKRITSLKEAKKAATVTSTYSNLDISDKIKTPYYNPYIRKDPTLFDEVENFNSTYNITTPSTTKDPFEPLVDEDFIDNLVLQLLTGSVLANKDFKISKENVLNNMEKCFKKRFNPKDDSLFHFSYWAEGFIEFLLMSSLDEEYVDDEAYSTVVSQALIKKLEALPKTNDYIEEYIDILKRYDLT